MHRIPKCRFLSLQGTKAKSAILGYHRSPSDASKPFYLATFLRLRETLSSVYAWVTLPIVRTVPKDAASIDSIKFGGNPLILNVFGMSFVIYNLGKSLILNVLYILFRMCEMQHLLILKDLSPFAIFPKKTPGAGCSRYRGDA